MHFIGSCSCRRIYSTHSDIFDLQMEKYDKKCTDLEIKLGQEHFEMITFISFPPISVV